MEDTAPIESPREANVNSGPFCLHPSTRENLLELGPAESFAGLSEKKKTKVSCSQSMEDVKLVRAQ